LPFEILLIRKSLNNGHDEQPSSEQRYCNLGYRSPFFPPWMATIAALRFFAAIVRW
jgi:hypothetical protein